MLPVKPVTIVRIKSGIIRKKTKEQGYLGPFKNYVIGTMPVILDQ